MRPMNSRAFDVNSGPLSISIVSGSPSCAPLRRKSEQARHGGSGSGSRSEPLASLDAHREAFAAIDAIYALVMDDDLASKQKGKPPIPEAGR